MKSHQFGLQGILFFPFMLGLQCLHLQAQDTPTTTSDNNVRDAYKGGSIISQPTLDQRKAAALADVDQAVEHNPNFAPAYVDRGFVKMYWGDLDGAIADFSHAIQISPTNPSSYTGRGEAKTKKGDLEGAVADYERVVALDPQYADVYANRDKPKPIDNNLDKDIAFLTDAIATISKYPQRKLYGIYDGRADAESEKGDLNAAIADYDKSISLNPTCAASFISRASAKEKKGDLKGALVDDDQGVTLDSKNATYYITRGELKIHQRDFDGAISDFTQATVLVPTEFDDTNTSAYIDRGLAKHEKGDLKGAIADYVQAISPPREADTGMKYIMADADKKIAANPSDPWALAGRANTKALTGDLTGAIADYTQAIALDPNNTKQANAYFYGSRAELEEKNNNPIGATNDLNKAINLAPKSADSYWKRGQWKEKQGNSVEAIADFDQAIELDSKKVQFYASRADAKFHQNDLTGAIADYDQAIAMDSKSARLYTSRGQVKDKKGDADSAVADYTQAIALDPQDGHAYAYRGRAKATTGDWDGAISDCDKALEWTPSLSIAYYYRGLAKDNKGDHEGAVADYNAAISHARFNGDKLPPTPEPPVPGSEKKVMLGTGFFVTSTGYILTDNHVVKGASTIRVKVGSSIMPAILAAADATNDIALLKISGTYPCMPLGDSNGASLGQTVFTVGFPEPELQGLSPKLTKGEISSLAGMRDNPSMFQISVPVQPGNSGGCLVDELGNVVGLIEATLSTVETAKSSGDLLQNVNYATKINFAKKLLGTVQGASSGLIPIETIPGPFTEKVKAVEQSTVFIIADSSGVPLPSNHLYTDSAGNTYSVSESDYQRLYPQKLALDAENKKLDQLNAASDAEARRIQQERQTLDNTNAQAVDAFNAEVDKHNSLLLEIKQETDTFNDVVDKFNAELKRVGTLIK
jgi:tetratricopeptide (TPR) repeat protein